MEHLTEVGVLLNREFRLNLHPYMVKTGIREVGKFMLDALNHKLAARGEELGAGAVANDLGLTLEKDAQGTPSTLYMVKFAFAGEAHSAVMELVRENGGAQDLTWLFAPLDQYIGYINRQPKRVMQPPAAQPSIGTPILG